MLRADGSRQAFAREHGVNSYTRIADYDFGAGRDYWSKTAAFWIAVRSEWQRRIDLLNHFSTSPETNGEVRIEAIFELAERPRKGGSVHASEIRDLIGRYVGDGIAPHAPK